MDLGSDFLVIFLRVLLPSDLKITEQEKDHTITYLACDNCLCLASLKHTLLKSPKHSTIHARNLFQVHQHAQCQTVYPAYFAVSSVQRPGCVIIGRTYAFCVFIQLTFRVFEIIHSSDKKAVLHPSY